MSKTITVKKPKRRRTCGYCKTQHILPPYKFKKWSGYCNSGCKRKRNQNHIPWLKNKIQEEFNALIAKGQSCEKCGQLFERMHCSHIWSVGSSEGIRFDIMNALPMCGNHHQFWWHLEPMESKDWFKENYPNRYEYLEFAKHQLKPWTVEELHEIRKAIKERNLNKLVRFKKEFVALDKHKQTLLQ